MLYKIGKKTAGIGIILMNIFTIVVFLLVILKILPYNSIGGGRLDSYQTAYQTAITSIFIMCFGIPIVAIASGLIKFGRFKFFLKVYLWLSFVFVCLNTIANLLGVTLFEKIIMALVTVIQAILFFRLATDKDSTENTNLEI
ncbi:hypothetical protein CSC2_08460 [Clostridium zeae]|uniref:Uncharacterized protein n=1 Tax=Clostridium zeae TaxID=2759022 RepID=A0ABQ1E6C3_9CLOT|nr:hypothetical protein [Clostridium zeae]GFZ30320.1 hypothetical protein CSC2_08460 [Clostridium zeae]